ALTAAATVDSTILIFARDAASASSGYSGLQGYGIPYQTVIVPSAGITLPTLNSSTTAGNYGAIVVIGEVSYDYSGSFRSALTDAQWAQLYAYQSSFGVRMVRLDVYPGPNFGATATSATADDQPISISNMSAFATANLKAGAQMSTAGLYHYPASITNTSLATEVAQFATSSGPATAAVINNFGSNRQQMVWFLPFATEWSATSNFLQHAWIHWATRGLYSGFRRIYFSTQVDDMFLATELYEPAGTEFRIRTSDLNGIRDWIPTINAKMPGGSSYIPEIGHNGNGDIEAAVTLDYNNSPAKCSPQEAIEYDEQVDTPLEFKKNLGSGTDIWPATPTAYAWSLNCAKLDALEQWWTVVANRDAFAHVSHTFSHSSLNNATFADANKEITFNTAWFRQIGLYSAKYFSTKGLIPPAITGLHNGDAIRAWIQNGITNVVGDNTRPVLRNTQSSFWPLTSTVNDNGYAGLNIIPRWATTIYYNCDTPDCTLHEWINTSGGSGDFQNLLKDARTTNSRNLLGLHWDPFMFHQANLRYTDMPSTVVNGVSQKLSLIQIWVEVVVNEMARLTNWPMITLKHDDLGAAFIARQTRDQCSPKIKWTTSTDGKTITGATVTTTNNQCGTKVPVTFPGKVTNTNGATTEQVGGDPLTLWVTMSGAAKSFTLQTPI
ncbi:hypothetical protein EJ05DRAFT_421851, partial [Pseudovirgaria hyperparasitica]